MAPSLKREQLTGFLHSHGFADLFIALGWDTDNLPQDPLSLSLDDGRNVFSIDRVVEKRGFVVCVCEAGDRYPTNKSDRQRLVNQLSRQHYEHLLIICGKGRQCWSVAIRPQNRPMRTVEVEWHEHQDIQPLMEKLNGMIFQISEEDNLRILDVVDRVRSAFMENAEKVTKKFYSAFQKELSAFTGFIKGIEDKVSREWYAALMLNRLMFIYFIQKKHFLDGDAGYLENRLKATQTHFGADRFHDCFYRHFLRRLFAEGLGTPEAERDPELKTMLGKVPYLNGGLFDLHEVERENDGIEIPDKAFEALFAFFGQYNWRLDSRPDASGRDINPDVIGYIFEKYINDRAAMGAYYTQEDITGYIARNTIIPFLLNRARDKCENAFDAENGIWRFLRDTPDNYIYDAVQKGCDIPDQEIPEHIRCGMDTAPPPPLPGLIARRKDWNTRTENRFALPTEIWRETMARRTRYRELKTRMANGEVHEINELITCNLDIERFASDALRHYEGSDFIAAFYEAIAGRSPLSSSQRGTRGITVLDPACGSGAFLFAALNILEPLYERCIERMRAFVDEDDNLRQQSKQKGPKKHPRFRAVLEDISRHQNEKYWIYKTIMLNNLYGVDLMKEAAEIAKLRLFLKLAAEAEYDPNKANLGLEPLPDIDFNIRAGNSLVGFVNMEQFEQAVAFDPWTVQREMDLDQNLSREIREKAIEVQKASERFRQAQDSGDDSYRKAKDELSERLEALNGTMNRYLAKQYGKQTEESCRQWVASHQPFHWLTEFYGIVEEGGGFDVVIGNPPYVEYSKVRQKYEVKNYVTESCGNLYAFMMERSRQISGSKSLVSMIVPLSGHSTRRMLPLVNNFYKHFRSCHVFNISADANPSILFPGVKFRLAIFIVSNRGQGIYTTGYSKWYAAERGSLFDLLSYTHIGNTDYKTAIPKVSNRLHLQIYRRLAWQTKDTVGKSISPQKRPENVLLYHSAPVNWVRSHTTLPYFHSERDGEKPSVKLKSLFLYHHKDVKILQGVLCSTLFFIWWLSNSDCYDLNKPEIVNFPECKNDDLGILSQELEQDMRSHSKRRIYNYKTTGRVEYDEFYMKESKPIIDRIDSVLAKYYGFTEEELDYIINYDIKYRMGEVKNEQRR